MLDWASFAPKGRPIPANRDGSGFQPFSRWARFPGARRPRLVWHRAFGPYRASQSAPTGLRLGAFLFGVASGKRVFWRPKGAGKPIWRVNGAMPGTHAGTDRSPARNG